MSNYQITLVNGIGKKNFGNNNSVGNKKEKINNTNKIKKMSIKGVLNSSSSLSGAIKSSGSLAGVGPITAALAATVSAADKGIDLYASYKTASTGNELYYGNLKAGKDIVMSLGTNLIKGAIKNEFITKNIVKRQNYSNDYGRNLYNLNNYGEKYKIR